MRPLRQLATGMALCALFSSPAWAQTQGQSTTTVGRHRRRARPRRLSSVTPACGTCRPVRSCRKAAGLSAATATNWDRKEAFTDISNFRVTFGYGVIGPARVLRQRRCCSDASTPTAGRSARAARRWTIRTSSRQWATGFGDIRVGAQVQPHGAVAAAAGGVGHSRGSSRSRPSDEDEGLGTGKLDFLRRRHRQRRSRRQGRAVRLSAASCIAAIPTSTT